MENSTKAEEHIKWMETNKASLQTTAENFGITRVELVRVLIQAGFEEEDKDWFRSTDEPQSTLIIQRPFLYA